MSDWDKTWSVVIIAFAITLCVWVIFETGAREAQVACEHHPSSPTGYYVERAKQGVSHE
jgi:hypothetical protein